MITESFFGVLIKWKIKFLQPKIITKCLLCFSNRDDLARLPHNVTYRHVYNR